MHRLGRGLPGYLILFATHAFVSQRQLWSRKPSTPQVFLLISMHYTPKGFIAHAASLHQSCLHCARFPTAASRRSLARVSVPVWPCALSGRLPITALVSLYLTN